MLKQAAYLFSAVSAVALATPALADEAADTIVVTATGSAIPAEQTGHSVTVIDRAEIESIQGADITRALVRIPGVSFARNGGIGATTSLFVRGGDSNQVLILVDGVRMADNAAPDGKYDLGTLRLDGAERIELLRGSNSVVWGSQAMAGVLAITTREANGVEASAEYGAYDTTNVNAAAGIARDNWGVSVDGGYIHSDGFLAKVGSNAFSSIDSWRIGGKARVRLGEGLTLKARLRYTDADLGIDQFGPVAQLTRDTSGGASLEYVSGGLSLTADASLNDTRRHYRETAFPSDYYSREQRFALTGRYRFQGNFALDFGGAHQWSRAYSTYDPRNTATLDSGHLLLGYYTDALTLASGVRIDSHDRFGTHWTTGANAMVRLAPGLRLRASVGQGFKAPTLYQLYAGFGQGNPALKPERTDSYDAGIEYRAGTFHASATWFRRDSRNLVDYVGGTYINIERARAEGVEIEGAVKLADSLQIGANYTWLRPRDLVKLRDLARRPRHTVNLIADWQTPLKGLSLGADLRMVGDTMDYLGARSYVLRSNLVANVRASVAISRELEVFGRIENVGNADYQTAYGFNTAKRSAYIGVRGRI